eukprot:m.85801 g.85801  ORF g.85801 m.85801 type:complete len:389 (+) comp14440_c1_seq1:64-1230(+)
MTGSSDGTADAVDAVEMIDAVHTDETIDEMSDAADDAVDETDTAEKQAARPEDGSLPPISFPPSPSSPAEEALKRTLAARWIATITAASTGAALRYWIAVLAVYTDNPIFTSAQALVLGCAVMGVVAVCKEHWDPHAVFALATGFCGCCTTFSTWQVEAGVLLVGGPKDDLSSLVSTEGQDRVLGWLSVLSTGLFVSIGAFAAGRAVALLYLKPTHDGAVANWQSFVINAATLSVVGVLACVAFFLIALVPQNTPHGVLTWIVLFAPFGMLARYYLQLYIPTISCRLLYINGTFVANLLGMIILLGLIVIRDHLNLRDTSRVASWDAVIVGLSTGFCGSLTTVSSMVNDAYTLLYNNTRGLSVKYIGFSLLLAQILVVIFLGPYVWTR